MNQLYMYSFCSSFCCFFFAHLEQTIVSLYAVLDQMTTYTRSSLYNVTINMFSLLNIITISLTLTLRGWTEQELRLNCCETNPAFQLQDPWDKEPMSMVVSIGKLFGQKSQKQISETKTKKIYSIINTRFNISNFETHDT